jgi:hypothetical protein
MTQRQAQTASQVVRAGGIVPAGARLAKDDAVDGVVARAYRHPVLPGRTVVRLTAENLVAGDDLEMATLGFGAGEDLGRVGKERKRPLGFPGWALVHDPKNARYALDVVKEFKKHARKARSKPGHAKDGIDAIAARLGKTVPQFLPSFFEEAGRVFIEHGAPSYAAAMFGKARAAEAVHALEVDEQHRVDGFLEFALAGAVTTKALTEYAKELAEHHAPAVAYGHFRQLCLQRTLGGMPPWAGMAKDLRRLAKAAKLDPDAEDGKLIAEIIESPALAKAAGEFWRAYQVPLVAIGKSSPAARGVLLDLFPTGSGDRGEIDDAWLDLIEQTGAIDGLVGDAVEDARPRGGRAAWLSKLTQHLARSWTSPTIGRRAFELLRRMAPRLIEDGAPISCCGRWFRLDLDLAELALELGVAVEPPEQARIDLAAWAKQASAPDRGRDPVRVAAHPTLGPLLVAAVAAELGDEPFDSVSRGKAGLLAAKRAWLEDQLARAESMALPAVEEVLDAVAEKAKAETFAELPDLYLRFAAIDLAPALARTLRIGLLDELGWPAVEDAARELDPDGTAEITLHGGLPAVVLASKTRAIAIGPTGQLATHDLVIPPKHELVTARYIAGQFLVVLKGGWRPRGYWSGAPHDLFDSDVSTWQIAQVAGRVAVLADGAWQEGDRPIRVGDRVVPQAALASYDGTTAWIRETKDGRPRMREVSASGEPGRFSWPAWLDGQLAPEWHIDGNRSYVLRAPDGLARSPLGVSDGVFGTCVVYQGTNARPTARKLVTIDGRTWSGPAALGIAALVELPGGESRPLLAETAWREGMTLSLVSADGTVRGVELAPKDRRTWRGSVAAYPDGLWHALTPRDLAGSTRLRAITDDDARSLIDGVLTLAGTADLAELVPVELIGGRLPEITHDRLRRGVAGVVALAAQLQVIRDRLRDDRAPGKASAHAATGPGDDALKTALGGWVDRRHGDGSAILQIVRCGELFRSDDRRDRVVLDVPGALVDWLPLAVVPGALVFLATAIAVPAGERRTIAELLALLVRELPDPARLRVWSGVRTLGDAAAEDNKTMVALRWHGGNAYAITRPGYWGNQVQVLEYAPDGVFRPLPQFEVGDELRGVAAVSADAVASAAVGAARSSPSDAAALAAATGLTPSEAVYLLAGCPRAGERGANFLDKDRREQLGLKATQAAMARDALTAIPRTRRLAALDEAGRGGDLAEVWIRHVGKRVAIPEALIAVADRELQAPIPPSEALAMFGGAATAPRLTVDGHWGLEPDGDLLRVGQPAPLVGQTEADDGEVFTLPVLQTACAYLPFLYAELPVGDPLRAQARVGHQLVLARLANPSLLLDAGTMFVDDEEHSGIDSMVAALGGEPITGLAGDHTGRTVPGAVIVRQSWTSGTPPTEYVKLHIHVRPATLDAKAQATVGKLAAGTNSWGYTPWLAIALMRSDELAQMMARIADTPVPPGGWEQNPAVSAARLVDKAARRLDVSPDAAALYLQYLVLLWPTPKNLTTWNGWTPARLAAANAELEDRELILEARRERAQRSYFLPGGWEALRAPHPPIESWKLPLYGRRNAEGAAIPALVRFAALAPFHVLFERAWKRIESGDVPQYDEVKR